MTIGLRGRVMLLFVSTIHLWRAEDLKAARRKAVRHHVRKLAHAGAPGAG